MLFDLRGRGRRRTVQAIYLMLAILMGGGLIFFGIGGNTSGGLFDAFSGNGGSGSDTFKEQVEQAQDKVTTTPADAAAWAALAKARYTFALNQDDADKRRAELRQADQAWQRYLALKPAKVDGDVASLMFQMYGDPNLLNDPEKAVVALEYTIDSRAESAGLYGQLFQYATMAGQTRKAQLAYDKALELTPKDQRTAFKAQLDQVKQQLADQAAGGSGTDAGTAAPSG